MTPKGEVVDLPKGGTPLDFAFHVHSDLGERCRGAKVNGRIAPLNQALQQRRRRGDHHRQAAGAQPGLALRQRGISGLVAQPLETARLFPAHG